MKESKRTRWVGPAQAWVAAFVTCTSADALLGRWILLPIFVMGFYGGTIIMSLIVLPFLERWRTWLRPRGVRIWYLAEFGVWLGVTVVLTLLAPLWLTWGWEAVFSLQFVGVLMLTVSVGVGAWACSSMGWARLLFGPALFPPDTEPEDRAPAERLVVMGPYRYVRNPLYITDVSLILGTALLAHNLGLVVLAVAYVSQLGMQLYFEERELKARFGDSYVRYRHEVPRFVPHLRPVDPARLYGRLEQSVPLGKHAKASRRIDTLERTVKQGAVHEGVYGTSARVHPAQERHGQIASRG